jgi:hypothetical protein
MKTLECSFNQEGIGKTLSNLTFHPFTFRDIRFGSIEGFLQSLKVRDADRAADVRVLAGYRAWKLGQEGNSWQDSQTLWFDGAAYPRASREYRELITAAYDACFEQNDGFVIALIESGDSCLVHTIGNHDQTRTTLTECEYIYQLYRLRARAQQILRED